MSYRRQLKARDAYAAWCLNPVQFFDALGLGILAVSGTQKAHDYGVSWPTAAVLRMFTGIGGSKVRDILTARVPTVLLADTYPTAALAGALVVVAGSRAGAPSIISTPVRAALRVFVRLMALERGWKLPVTKP